MSQSRKLVDTLTILGALAAACAFVIAFWFVSSPRNQRSVIVQVGSQSQSDRVVSRYVQAFPGTNQIVEELIANPEFTQIRTVTAKADPQVWLQEHLHIRRILDDRIEIIATARRRDVPARDLETVVGLATDSLLSDAASNGLQAEVISQWSADGL